MFSTKAGKMTVQGRSLSSGNCLWNKFFVKFELNNILSTFLKDLITRSFFLRFRISLPCIKHIFLI